MKVTETSLPGVLVLEPRIFRDDRGFFLETYSERVFSELGLPTGWRQDNFSQSVAGVVRGLHYQVGQPQGKLVRVVHGTALDVAVDLRRSSPNFGRHVTIELKAEEGKMVWIPEGFGHGFSVLSDSVCLSYKVTDYYAPTAERTLLWNDPALGIDWRLNHDEAIVSGKDRQGRSLGEAEVFA